MNRLILILIMISSLTCVVSIVQTFQIQKLKSYIETQKPKEAAHNITFDDVISKKPISEGKVYKGFQGGSLDK